MKSGQLFWGFFLVTIGALFLLTKYDVVTSDFSFIWEVWPMIFVFWGALVIFKNSIARPIINAVFGFFLGVLLFGFFVNVFSGFECDRDEYKYDTSTFSEEFNDSIKFAELKFNSGGGTFELINPTDKLINGTVYGSLGEYDLFTNVDGENADVELNFSKKNFNLFNGKMKNHIEFGLNEMPVWDLYLNFGAAKAIFDLSPYKVNSVEINTGAANVRLKLGDKYDSTFVYVDMGVAKLNIEVPENVGCQVKGDMVLMSRSFEGMKKVNKKYYETPDFENSTKKIFIKVDGGVSTIKVSTY